MVEYRCLGCLTHFAVDKPGPLDCPYCGHKYLINLTYAKAYPEYIEWRNKLNEDNLS